MTTVMTKSITFATDAHAGQVRKYTGVPYITHPLEVAALVSSIPGSTEAMAAAAVLHDVVEDTDVTQGEIIKEFGSEIANLVYWVTKVSVSGDGDRATRKAMDRDKYAMGPPDAQTIKLADIISNARDLAEKDPKFAKVWFAEARELVAVLDRGDGYLYGMATKLIVDYYAHR